VPKRSLSAMLFPTAFLFCSALQSASEIRGKVIDPAGAIISKATIRVLDEKSRKTVLVRQTDGSGLYELQGLAPGRYMIAVSSSGFSEELVDVGVVQGESDVNKTIRLRPLDCDAPHVNCDSFGETPISEPHPVVAHGYLAVSDTETVDLDTEASVPLVSGSADFRLTEKEGGLYLTPLNRARISNVCGAGFGQVAVGNEKSPLRIDGLGPSSAICIRTNHKRYSKIFVTREVQPGDKQISIYIVTRAS
jgi:hypothetical protein